MDCIQETGLNLRPHGPQPGADSVMSAEQLPLREVSGLPLQSLSTVLRRLAIGRTGLLALMGAMLLSASAAPAAQAQTEADLSVVTTASEETTAGSAIAFSISVANFGPDSADDVTLTDVVPTGATLVCLTQQSGPAFTCSTPATGDGGTVSCTNPLLVAGAEATFTLAVDVDSGAPPGSFITDTAAMSTSTFDPNEENNASTASTLVGPVIVADLGVQQSAPEGAVPGSDLTYTITVTSGGPEPAGNATLSETLPDTTTFVSLAAPAGWNCTTPAVGAGGNVQCTQASLPASRTETFTLLVHIPSDTPSQTVLDNIVTVSTLDSDPNVENDQAATSRRGLGGSQRHAHRPGNGDRRRQARLQHHGGQPRTGRRELGAADRHPAHRHDVRLPDPRLRPFFLVLDPWCGTGRDGGAVALGARFGGERAVHPAGGDRPEDRRRSRDHQHREPVVPPGEPNPANNEASDATTVVGLVADLKVQSIGPATAAPGDTLTYAITLTNDGPDTVYDVALAIPLPAHTAFASFAQGDGPPFEPAVPDAGETGTVNATRDETGVRRVRDFHAEGRRRCRDRRPDCNLEHGDGVVGDRRPGRI